MHPKNPDPDDLIFQVAFELLDQSKRPSLRDPLEFKNKIPRAGTDTPQPTPASSRADSPLAKAPPGSNRSAGSAFRSKRGMALLVCLALCLAIPGITGYTLWPRNEALPAPPADPEIERRKSEPGPVLPDPQSPLEQPNLVAIREWSIRGPATSLSSADARGWREDITVETGKSDVAVLDVTADAIRPMEIKNRQRNGNRLSFSAECETQIKNRLTVTLFFCGTGSERQRIASLGSILTHEDYRDLLDAAKNGDVRCIQDTIHTALTSNSPDGRWTGSPSDILPMLKEAK